MHKPSIKSMQVFLEANGYDTNQIASMTKEELLQVYGAKVNQEILEFQQGVLDNVGIEALAQVKQKKELEEKIAKIQEKVKNIHQDIRKIYAIMDEFIEDFSIDELRYLIFNNVRKIPSNLVDKVIQIKKYQYQILWLDKIEENLSILPEEEKKNLMAKYCRMDNIDRKLYRIYKNSFDKKEVLKMAEVAKNKLNLLSAFSSQELEENYEIFYNESEEKHQLMNEIVEFTHSYSRNMLKKMSMEQLANLRDSIRNQISKENEEKRTVAKYVKILENSMRSVDEQEFQTVCLDAINHLNNEQLQKVIETLSSQNKFFANKFEGVARQIRGKVKAKII